MPDRATRRSLVLGAALVATGLQAGLFYAFACAVMPGLAGAGDRTLIDAMQQINEAIENPAFLATFLGAPLLTLWALIERRRAAPRVARWILAALLLYGLGLLVTGALNIPLNDELAAAGELDRIADPAAVRDEFEHPWVEWNVVRAVAIAAAFCCLTRAQFLDARRARP